MITQAVSELRLRMIEDMKARQLNRHTQRSHIYSCKRFAAYLKRSPETATADEVRAFQLYLMETGPSICNRNRIMTGVKFLFRVTLRRHDLASEIYYVREPQKLPLIMSPAEAKRLLAMANNLKVKVMLTLCYGCGLRAGEACRLKVGDIDSELKIIRIVQAKGRKDRHVMLPPEVLDLLRQWWKVRPTRYDDGMPLKERWLFPGRRRGEPLTTRQLSRLFHEAAEAAGIKKPVTLHSLRHSFATHLFRARLGYSFDPGGPGPPQARYDGPLYPRRHGADRRHRKPDRQDRGAASKEEGPPEALSRAHGAASVGDRRHLPRSRPLLAHCQPGPCKPRPA
jgi:integrase/recombinase XerD